jgi:glutamate dehydrogenase/leucine dehydrogenase
MAPGKAANAGGVAVSGLEMSQNAMKLSWTREEVQQKLQQIMGDIHASCVAEGKQKEGPVNYIRGANIAGFRRVAEAMVGLGF